MSIWTVRVESPSVIFRDQGKDGPAARDRFGGEGCHVVPTRRPVLARAS